MRVIIYPGQTLWDSLKKQHIVLERPCGGKGTCGMCRVHVQGVGDVVSCRFARPGAYEVVLPQQEGFATVFAQEEAFRWEAAAGEGFVAAVDIGTTTVAVAISDGVRQVRKNFVNPQRAYGADVITRIEACNSKKEQELQEMLLEALLGTLGEGIRELDALRSTEESGFRDSVPQRVCRVVVAANTTMLHILRGFSCEGLGRAPFSPVEIGFGRDTWNSGGITYEVEYLPGISAFVGADIVSGIYGLGIMEREAPSLLIDLGTNGEMAVGNRKRLLCASAAAGPAFEGSRLGMRLHASGILRCLSRMLREKAMDGTGLLAPDYFEDGYPVDRSGEEGLRFCQEDIRGIQMAKGAIRAGVDILLEEYGIKPEELGQVFLAGGMGYYLDPADAVAAGLLPPGTAGKVRAAGNTCMQGIFRYLAGCSEAAEAGNIRETLGKIAQSAEEIVLAEHDGFQEKYLAAMDFPTDKI